MLKFTRQKDLALFVELAKEPRPRRPEDLSMRVVIPAYILSELKAGFQIGTDLVLPLPGDRPGGGVDNHFGGNDAIASRGDFHAAEDLAFRHGGRLEPGRGFTDEEFLLGRWLVADHSIVKGFL